MWAVGARPGTAAAVGGVVGAAGLVLALLVASRRVTGAVVWRGVALTLLVVATAAMGTGARVSQLRDCDVSDIAGRGGVVVGTVTVSGDPRPVPRGVLVPARVRSLALSSRVIEVNTPVLLLADTTWAQVRWDATYRITAAAQRPLDLADAQAAVLRPRSPPVEVARPGIAWRAAGSVRAATTRVTADLPGPAPGLLPGLAFGDTSGLPAQLDEQMRAAGLAHLSAVSGANVTLVCGGVVALLGSLRLGRRWQVPAGALALAALVVVARPEPSVLRAVAMGGVGLLGLATGRPGRAPAALSVAVLVLLALDPWLARSYGFALSVCATAGIIAVGRPLGLRWRTRMPAPLADALAVTLAAQAAVTPVLVLLEPSVSLYAVVANLAVGPVVAPTVLLSSVAAVLAVPLPWLASAVALPAAAGAWWIATVAAVVSGAPGGVLPWPSGPPGALLAASILVLTVPRLLTGTLPRQRRHGRGVPAAVAAAGLAAGFALGPGVLADPGHGWQDGWAVVLCDVGQGQAVLVRSGPQSAVMIDAGPDPSAVGTCLDEAGVRTVDLLVLSHLHADHVDGLAGVLATAHVSAAWVSPCPYPAAAAATVARLLGDEAVPAAIAQPSIATATTQVDDATVEVLWPERVLDPAAAADGDGTAIDDASIVVRITRPGMSVLVLGDAEVAAQTRLLALGRGALASDVVVVAHHGSRTQVPALYQLVGARVALVSAGRHNDYGHPAPQTVQLLNATGAEVRSTSDVGTVGVAAVPGGLQLLTGQ